jgi:alkylation response protein AidB-like acyl-CoA dehydrogenase
MDFSHSEERQMLLAMLERYRQERHPFAARQAAAYGDIGFDRARWLELAELGVVASLFSVASGGSGGEGFDIMALFEWMGRALVVEPFLASLMVGRALAAAGGHPQLESIAAGRVVAGFAHQERQGDAADIIRTAASREGRHWILQGAKAVVAHAEAADGFLVSARSPAGLTLFLVPRDVPGLLVQGYLNVEGGRSGDVYLNHVRLDDDAVVGGEGNAAPLIDCAIEGGLLALSAEAVGIMDVLKEATLEHLRTRVQFGQPIGRFQALQHRMASVLLEIEQARSSVINAAAAFDRAEQAERSLALSAAKYTIGRTGTLVAEEAIQLHGGIGMTWELPLSHYAKRLIMIGHQLGDEDHHLERFIRGVRTTTSGAVRPGHTV